MKFWTGFIIGAVTAGYVVTNMTDEQRERAAAKMRQGAAKVRQTQVGEAVATGVSDIAETAGERVASAVSSGTDSVAEFVEADHSAN